jgi:hypothetical protein
MKKIVSILLCALTLLIVFPITSHADVGPKPSVIIDFSGLESRSYYATLLSSEKSTGPYSALSENNADYARYQQDDEQYDIFLKFAQYKDTDGFYFLQYFEDCSQTQRFSWTYYPPQRFKILLYFPDTNTFLISSEPLERYAFDSYFTADISSQDNAQMTVTKSYNYTNEILSLIVRILLTIAIEILIALLFGFRQKKLFRFIVLVNIFTQVALNTALGIIDYYSGFLAFMIFYVLLEIAVFIIEAVLYTWYLRKYSEKKISAFKPGIYALTANAASFILGYMLAYWLPGIF